MTAVGIEEVGEVGVLKLESTTIRNRIKMWEDVGYR